jgi:predicted PurR-regulated permease PerM
MTSHPAKDARGRKAGEGTADAGSSMFDALPTVSLAVLALLACLTFLRFTRELMIPIVLSVLISYAVAPLAMWLDRVGVPRWVGAGLVVMALAALLGVGTFALGDQLVTVAERLPQTVQHMRRSLQSSGGGNVLQKIQQAVAEMQHTAAETVAPGSPQPTGRQGEETSDPPGQQGQQRGVEGNLLLRGSMSVVVLLGHLTVIFFLVYFLLLYGERYQHLIVTLGETRLERKITSEILQEINWQIRQFLLVRLATSIVVGVATWFVLLLMGVQQAGFWAVLAGVFNSIPYFGPIIVSGGLAVVGLMQFGTMTKALGVSAAALAITSLEGWLLEPLLMGRAEKMNVLAVFIGLLVWSWIWGAWGTILAVPMLTMIKAVCDHVEDLHPIGRLLGELPGKHASPSQGG